MHDNDELKFIGGVFFDLEIPKDKKFLLKYFRTGIEKQFLRYFLCFNSYEYFPDHTGSYCQKRWARLLWLRYCEVLAAHEKAKIDMDLELLDKIEKGKLRLRREINKSLLKSR